MKIFKVLGILFLAMLGQAQASTCSGAPHTVHTITTNKPATCTLSKLFEPDTFCIVDLNGNNIEQVPMQIVPGQNAGFGMLISSSAADFNMEYALTCVSNDGADVKSPKSIFTIGANLLNRWG